MGEGYGLWIIFQPSSYGEPEFVLVNGIGLLNFLTVPVTSMVIGDVVVKHGVVMHLYSLHGNDFGNKAFPSSRVKKAEPSTNKQLWKWCH